MPIEFRNVSKSFPPKDVLAAVSFVLEDGGIYCLMGPSGIGKTTLLRLLMGLEIPDAGEIRMGRGQSYGAYKKDRTREQTYRMDGALIAGKGQFRTKRKERYAAGPNQSGQSDQLRISAVFQENRLLNFADAVQNIRAVSGKDGLLFAPEEVLDGMLEKEAWRQPAGRQSGGMQRRVAIARALAARSELLVMDEPFTGLDGAAKERTIRKILSCRAGRTLIVVTHQEEDARLLGAEVLRL